PQTVAARATAPVGWRPTASRHRGRRPAGPVAPPGGGGGGRLRGFRAPAGPRSRGGASGRPRRRPRPAGSPRGRHRVEGGPYRAAGRRLRLPRGGGADRAGEGGGDRGRSPRGDGAPRPHLLLEISGRSVHRRAARPDTPWYP